MKKIYLAIPYSGMCESSFEQSLVVTTHLMKSGDVNIFSPIINSHLLAKSGLSGDWSFWETIDKQYVEWCDEIWVLIPKEGFSYVINSKGVQEEIVYGKELKKSIKYIYFENNEIYLL